MCQRHLCSLHPCCKRHSFRVRSVASTCPSSARVWQSLFVVQFILSFPYRIFQAWLVLGIRDMAGNTYLRLHNFQLVHMRQNQKRNLLMQAWKSAAIRGIPPSAINAKLCLSLIFHITPVHCPFQSPKSLFTLRIQIGIKLPLLPSPRCAWGKARTHQLDVLRIIPRCPMVNLRMAQIYEIIFESTNCPCMGGHNTS